MYVTVIWFFSRVCICIFICFTFFLLYFFVRVSIFELLIYFTPFWCSLFSCGICFLLSSYLGGKFYTIHFLVFRAFSFWDDSSVAAFYVFIYLFVCYRLGPYILCVYQFAIEVTFVLLVARYSGSVFVVVVVVWSLVVIDYCIFTDVMVLLVKDLWLRVDYLIVVVR